MAHDFEISYYYQKTPNGNKTQKNGVSILIIPQ